jgi:hypothetical protein
MERLAFSSNLGEMRGVGTSKERSIDWRILRMVGVLHCHSRGAGKRTKADQSLEHDRTCA